MRPHVLFPCLACLAAAVQVPGVGPFSKDGAIGRFGARVGGFLKQTAQVISQNRDVMQQKSVGGGAEAAAADLNALKAALPQVREAGLQLCGQDRMQLCKLRMSMFETLASRINQGDADVLPLLRVSLNVLQEYMQMGDNLHNAISSLTLRELEERPPAGVKLIADINPRDGALDRYELSEYMKTLYTFTLSGNAAAALGFDQRKLSDRLRRFISFDEIDARPKPVEGSGAPQAAPMPVEASAAPQAAPMPVDGSGAPQAAPMPVDESGAPQAAPMPGDGSGAPQAAPTPVDESGAPQPA